MVSAIHWHESAVGVPVSPSWTPSLLPPHPIPQGRPSAPALSALFHALNLDSWSISHMVIYMFQCYSLTHPTLAFPPRVQKSVLYICVSFAVSHIGCYVLIHCIGVFLSDLLHTVKWAPVSSISLELTQMHSF